MEYKINGRCKFVVESVTHHVYGVTRLEARYDQPASDKDRAFPYATPSGKMEITVQDERVFDLFQPGRHVYVDVTSADDE